MYAELMIRDVTGKPYTGSTSSLSLDVDDLKEDRDKLDRKIKSLQSKKSRLTKIAQYDAEAAKELEQVVADIDRLNQFRGVSKTSAKVIVKDAGLDNVRAALTDLQSDDSVDDATREKIMNLLKKIG
jgi:Mg/Co/Ni transporter MgtE